MKSLNEEETANLTELLEESLYEGTIPEDWLDSHLCPLPKPEKDPTKIASYRIITMQNTVGKLLEKMVAHKLACELEEKELLPPTLGSYRRRKDTWMNAAVLASDVYDGFERGEETLVAALDLEDAYNRVQFSVVMRTLVNLEIDPLIIIWIGKALMKRKVALRLGRWSSETTVITPGLPQGSTISPVLFNVYTLGITSNQMEGPGRVLSFADDILVYRHGKDRRAIANSMQEELERIGNWCQENNGHIHPDKACVLWCSLNNHAVNAEMPTVTVGGKDIKREQTLRYLGVVFDRTLSGKDHITRIISKARKGLIAVKTMAYANMPQKTLVILYQALVLSVIEYGLAFVNLSETQLKRLEVIQNEGMRAILGCTMDTSAAAMRYALNFPTMATRYRLAQVKAYLKVSADTKHPLHNKLGRDLHSRLKRGTEWMNQAASTISDTCPVEEIRKGEDWLNFEDKENKYTHVEATLGRECREWPAGEANAAVESIIERVSEPGDVTVFTDGSVQREVPTKSGWGMYARINGTTAMERAGATTIVTSSMVMEVKAITETLRWMNEAGYTRAVIATDSMSTLQKIEKKMMYADWVELIREGGIEKLQWIFCPGHADVIGNERADTLAGQAPISGELTLDPPTILANVKEFLLYHEPLENSYTLDALKEKGIKRGSSRTSTLSGKLRRYSNQMMMETISLHTLRWLLGRREEEQYSCELCLDFDAEPR